MSYTEAPEMQLMAELASFQELVITAGWLKIPDIIEACDRLEKTWRMYIEGELNPIVIHTGANIVMPLSHV